MSTALDFAAILSAERAKAKGAVRPVVDETQSTWGKNGLLNVFAEHYRIQGVEDAFCVPDYVSCAEEVSLQSAVNAHDTTWVTLPRRRLQVWGGIPQTMGTVVEAMPSFLKGVCDRLVLDGVFPPPGPDNCLLNEYSGGQGIDVHQDGPLYRPIVAVLSLLKEAEFDFYAPSDNPNGNGGRPSDLPTVSFTLPPRSLLVFRGDAYLKWWHGIRDQKKPEGNGVGKEESAVRLSLTLRCLSNRRERVFTDAEADDLNRAREFFLRAVSEKALD